MSAREKEASWKEATLLSKMRHPNIVSFSASFQGEGTRHGMLFSCCSHVVLMLFSCCSHVVLMLFSCCSHVVLMCVTVLSVSCVCRERKPVHRDGVL